jgi:magnesium transporter
MANIESAGNIQVIRNDGFTWIDVSRPTREEMKELGRNFSFHELNLDDCLSKIQIPKIDRYSDHIFLILHFPVVERESVARASQLSVFMGAGYLVTVHQDDLRRLIEIFAACATDDKQRTELMGRSSGYLFHSVVDALVDDLLDFVRKARGNIEDIEDAVFDERTSVAKEVSYLRRQTLALRRMAVELKATLLEFGVRDIQKFSAGEDLVPYFDDVRDHLEKAVRILDEAKDTVEIFKDTDFMHGVDRSNKILAVLTIIFTLSMPATILSSFYGMNIDMPAIQGPYATLGIVSALSLFSAFGMFWYFRRLKWI